MSKSYVASAIAGAFVLALATAAVAAAKGDRREAVFTFCLSWLMSPIGTKRTNLMGAVMSASDPKRT
jgi:hypothetical protein